MIKKNDPKEIKVKVVDGEQVRDDIDTDFIGGSNWMANNYVPVGEIWVEKLPHFQDMEDIVNHEMDEVIGLIHGEEYKTAHNRANEYEHAMREFQQMYKKEDVDKISKWILNNKEGYDKEELVNVISKKFNLDIVEAENKIKEILKENKMENKYVLKEEYVKEVQTTTTNISASNDYQPGMTTEEKYLSQVLKQFKQHFGREADLDNKEDRIYIDAWLRRFGFTVLSPQEQDKIGKEMLKEVEKDNTDDKYFDTHKKIDDYKNSTLKKYPNWKNESYNLINEHEIETDEILNEEDSEYGETIKPKILKGDLKRYIINGKEYDILTKWVIERIFRNIDIEPVIRYAYKNYKKNGDLLVGINLTNGEVVSAYSMDGLENIIPIYDIYDDEKGDVKFKDIYKSTNPYYQDSDEGIIQYLIDIEDENEFGKNFYDNLDKWYSIHEQDLIIENVTDDGFTMKPAFESYKLVKEEYIKETMEEMLNRNLDYIEGIVKIIGDEKDIIEIKNKCNEFRENLKKAPPIVDQLEKYTIDILKDKKLQELFGSKNYIEIKKILLAGAKNY